MKQKVAKGERVKLLSFKLCSTGTNWILNVMLRPLYASTTKLAMLTWQVL